MKPILSNTEMVRAIQNGTKTATRRVVKPHYRDDEMGFRVITNANTGEYVHVEYIDDFGEETRLMPEPYRPGDILYVRETWARIEEDVDPIWFEEPGQLRRGGIIYRAEYPDFPECKWHPSIHMPREAARIFLRVTGVRVERLQEIDDAQAYAEGAEGVPCNCDGSEVFCSRCCNTGWFISPRSEFARIWDSTIKPADRALCGWKVNPWVWVIEFERCEEPEERKVIANA